MLKALLLFTGLTPALTPPKPERERTPVPAHRRPAPLPPRPSGLDFALAMRVLSRARQPHGMHVPERDLEAARRAVGPVVAEYVRALTLSGRRVPMLGNSDLERASRLLAFEAELRRFAEADVDAWEEAETALLKEAAACRRLGPAVPRALSVPASVRTLIEARQAERLRRMQARGGRRQDGTEGSGALGKSGVEAVLVPAEATSVGPRK